MTPYTERDIWKLDQKINARGVPVDIELARRNIEIFRYLEKQSNERVREVTGGLVSSASQVAKLRDFINSNFPNRKEMIPQKQEIPSSIDDDAAWDAYFEKHPEAPHDVFYGVDGKTHRSRIHEWLKREHEPLKNLQAATLDAILKKPDVHPDLRTLLEARKISGKTSVKKFQSMLNTHVDGRVYDTSRYHTAHTGRHGGTRLQTQNFFRPKFGHEQIVNDMIPQVLGLPETMQFKVINDHAVTSKKLHLIEPFDSLYDNTSDVLSSMLRACIKSPTNKKFVCADYVGIETCVIMWLTGEQHALDMLNRGESLYKWIAGLIFNKPASEIIKGTNEYLLGKISVLALVYGMGQQKQHPTFSETCKSWGADCDFETGKHIVYGVFRELFSNIPEYWYSLQAAFTEALTQRKNVKFKNLKILFEGGGEFLFIELPSGRRIAYNRPEMRKVTKTFTDESTGKEYTRESWQITYMGHHTITRKWTRLSTWGGKLTENIDQAIAADFLRQGMINAEAADYPIIMSVHDEILTEVDQDFGSVGEFEKIITQKSSWAEGCPFNAEGWEGERYRK